MIAAVRTDKRESSVRLTSNIPTMFRWCAKPIDCGNAWKKRRESDCFEQVGLIEIGPPRARSWPACWQASRRTGSRSSSSAARQIERPFYGAARGRTVGRRVRARAGFLLRRTLRATRKPRRPSATEPSSSGETVLRWNATSNGVEVQTDRDVYPPRAIDHCGRCVGRPAAGRLADSATGAAQNVALVPRRKSDVYRWRPRHADVFVRSAGRRAAAQIRRAGSPAASRRN